MRKVSEGEDPAVLYARYKLKQLEDRLKCVGLG